MRRADGSSSGPVQLDAHGSIMASEKSSTPRLRMASCQRGSACTIASQDMNSSAMIGACTPGTGVEGQHGPVGQRDDGLVGGALGALVEHDVRLPRQRVVAGRPGQHRGLRRLVQRRRTRSGRSARAPARRAARRRRRAISSAVSGSSGWADGGDGGLLDGGHERLRGPRRSRSPRTARCCGVAVAVPRPRSTSASTMPGDEHGQHHPGQQLDERGVARRRPGRRGSRRAARRRRPSRRQPRTGATSVDHQRKPSRAGGQEVADDRHRDQRLHAEDAEHAQQRRPGAQLEQRALVARVVDHEGEAVERRPAR